MLFLAEAVRDMIYFNRKDLISRSATDLNYNVMKMLLQYVL